MRLLLDKAGLRGGQGWRKVLQNWDNYAAWLSALASQCEGVKVSVACVPALGPAPPHAAQLVKDIWCTTLLLLVLVVMETLETVCYVVCIQDMERCGHQYQVLYHYSSAPGSHRYWRWRHSLTSQLQTDSGHTRTETYKAYKAYKGWTIWSTMDKQITSLTLIARCGQDT